jgi:energy-coupling factor transport system ATP-binding protein
LKEISFSVQAGEKIAVVGRNGSGKTTLLQTIAGLIPPAAGAVAVGGDGSRKQDDPPSIGLLLQEADNQFVAGSVRSELLLGLRRAADGDADVERRLEKTAERFDLTAVLGRNPHRLSGGEKQRLAFATIWMAEPDILLLDEPTTHLDAQSRNRCYQFVDSVCGDDSAVVWATPGGEDLMRVDNVLWLEDGEIRYFGSLRDLLTDLPLLKRSGIVLPPLAALASRLVDSMPGMDMDGAMFEPDGGVASHTATAARVSILAERVQASRGGHGVRDGSGTVSNQPHCINSGGASSASKDRVVVALNEVSFSYGSGDAIRLASLRIGEGRCVGVTGPNGAGKSTLLSLASGALQPSRGGIERLYEDAFEAGAQNVFHLFQNPERMFFAETVREEIAFGLRHVHGQNVRLDSFIRRALREADLDPVRFMDRSPVRLSFGEMRRLAFAVFIALGPTFLLLDEPTACLDDSGAQLLRTVLHRFVGDGGTVMIATHDVEFLFEVCDRLIYLEEGRIAHDVDISSKCLPEDFKWPCEPRPLILALQEEMSRLGLDVSPRATTIDNLVARLL